MFALFLAAAVAFAFLKIYLQLREWRMAKTTDSVKIKESIARYSSKSEASKDKAWYQDMFFRIQNLEDNPSILEPARNELLAMFSRGLSLSASKGEESILKLEHFDSEKLLEFIQGEHDRVLMKWEGYLDRRKLGQGPQLFKTVEEAKAWVIQQAPVKFVDGSWLSHIHKITTPFSLRSIAKDAWQVLSEELGDGDLSKHHVYLYRQLLQDIGCPLPDSHSPEFIELDYWKDESSHGKWEAAVGQLLVSLFPNEFLPEILGFNMHYELITLETMQAAYELQRFGINPLYFLIHIAIDNADSGHTAMATLTVTRYLEMIRSTEGEAALKQAWKRVQVGYIMSQTLGEGCSDEQAVSISGRTGAVSKTLHIPLDDLSSRVVEIFQAKAMVSHKFHVHCRARIGGQALADWLAPETWKNVRPEEQVALLTALSRAKPWVRPGDGKNSPLIRELSWGGRMFGAFTHKEVVVLSEWIDSLGAEGNTWLYWNFTQRQPLASNVVVNQLQDPTRHHPVILTGDTMSMSCKDQSRVVPDLGTEQSLPGVTNMDRLADVIALWFAHISLLENTINIPSITSNPLHANILRVLRAQAGFAVEAHVVAGMDEMKRLTCPSLVDIGLNILSKTNWGMNSAKPQNLHEVLDLTEQHGQTPESINLAADMLRCATRPVANLGLLLGLSRASLELVRAVSLTPNLLSLEDQKISAAIVARVGEGLQECVKILKETDELQYSQLARGYGMAMSVFERVFH